MPVWMIWVILGLGLMALEIPSQGFYMLWFGVGALIAAAVSLFAGLPVQIIVFLSTSVLMVAFLRPITHRIIYRNTPEFDTNVDRLVGAIGDVVETVDNLRGTGGVRVFGADYNALSRADGVVIEPGRRARVHAVKGARLVVEPVDSVYPDES